MARLAFGMPVYNGEPFVAGALDSLCAQEFSEIRIVISDNGSTDATEEICRAVAAADPRVEYHRYENNRGAVWNHQNVVDLAEGAELFSFMGSDDIKLPGFASLCIDALDAIGDCVGAFTLVSFIAEDGTVVRDSDGSPTGLMAATAHERIRNLIRAEYWSETMYAVVRADALHRTRGIRGEFSFAVVIAVELLCAGKIVLVPQRLFQRRHHTGQASAQASRSSWFGAGHGLGSRLPELQVNLALYLGVTHSRLPWWEKLRCAATIAWWWTLPRWRAVLRDMATLVGIPETVGRFRERRRMREEAGGA